MTYGLSPISNHKLYSRSFVR